MCVFLISPVPIAEPLTSELIDTPVFYNLAPRPIKYRVSVPIPSYNSTSLQGKTMISDDFELGGEDEKDPTSRVTFSTLLRKVWDVHRKPGEHLCVYKECTFI